MVRLIKFGNKIKLLPSLEGEETCRNCREDFNASTKRRACYDICGHVSCLECIFKETDGCLECKLGDNREIISNGGNESPGEILGDEEDENQSDIDEENGIIVISSVLGKPRENGDSFPEIRSLSMSALPVLECMSRSSEVSSPDPVVITLDDDEEEFREIIDLEEQPEEVLEERSNEIIHEYSGEIVAVPYGPIDLEGTCEVTEEDDDIQEVPVEEYTKLAGEEDDEEDEWDVQSVTSHLTVIDPFHFSDDEDENNSGSFEPTPRNLRKRRFSQFTLPSDGEDNSEDESLGYIETNSRNMKSGPLSIPLADDDDDNWDIEEENGKSDFGKHKCKDCNSRFAKKLLLARHLARNHREGRPFSCTLCQWPFHNQRNLNNHMLTHTKERPFKCLHCDGAYNRKYTLDKHLEKLHGIIVLKRGKSQRSTLNSPNRNQNNCQTVSEPLSRENEVSNLAVSQSNGSIAQDPLMTEEEEQEQVDLEDSQVSYQEEGPIPSPPLSSISISSDDSSEQKENKQRDHKSALLKRIYMKKSVENGGIRDKKKRRKCKMCKMTFSRKYEYDRHVRIAHLKKSQNLELVETLRPHGNFTGGFICKVCDISFRKKRQLEAHSKIHLEKLKCKICGVQKSVSLERHLEKYHGIKIRWREKLEEESKNGGNGGRYCPECQSLFGGDDLNEKVWYAECGHLSCMDCVNKADGLGCGQCTTERVRMEDVLGRFFDGMEEKEKRRILEVKVVLRRLEDMGQIEKVEKRNLEEAVKIRDEVELVENFKTITKSNGSRTFYCPYCQREFRGKVLLGLHLQEMHKDKRPFACDICQWPFSSGKDLERHRIIHTNDKPFRCNLCPVTFNRKSTRDRHVEKVHLKWRRI